MEKRAGSEFEIEFRDLSEHPEDSKDRLPAKFTIFGEALIEKKVKSISRSGRVYLPPDWVGKRVKIIRID